MSAFASQSVAFVVDHWRGKNSLLITPLLTVLALRIALGFVHNFLPAIAILPWVATSALLLIWQSVGALRAGDHCLRVRGSAMWYWCAIAAVFVAGILAVVQIVDALSAHSVPEAKPQPEKIVLPVINNGTTVVLQGDLDWELRSAFLHSLSQHATITTVQLESYGGLVFVARALALKIAELELNTSTDTHCYCACTIVFLAGDQRSMGPEGALGFHQYAMNDIDRVNTISVSEELEKDRLKFAEQGVSAEFLEKIFKASHEDMYIPERALLLESGVLTEP